MANRFEQLSGRGKAGVLLASALACALVLAALGEAGLRVRQAWFQSAAMAWGVEDYYRYDAALDLRVPVAGFRSARLNTNALGFRGAEIPRDKPAGTMRVAFLGGSTTFCAEVGSDEATWPRQTLLRLEAARPGRRFDEVNAGVPGYTLGSITRSLERRVAALRPDVIVIYEATNDLTLNSDIAARQSGLAVRRGHPEPNWLTENSLLAYLVWKNLLVLYRQWQAEGDTGKLTVPSEQLTPPFARDLTALVRAARQVTDKVALVTFATRMRAGQSQEALREAGFTALYYMPHRRPDDILRDYAAYNDTIRAVARQEGVALIEAAGRIPADARHFVDTVHLTDRGAALMGDIVADGLLAFGWFGKPGGE